MHCEKQEELSKLNTRVGIIEEKINSVNSENDKLYNTLEKLDKTQADLAIQIAEMNSTFTTIKYIVGISIALFGGIFAFLINNLIQLI